MRKIKVLHIITRLANGGAGENTLYTINGLDKDKYKIDFMVGEETEKEILDKIELDKEINLYKINGLVRDVSPLNEIKGLLNLYRKIKEKEYDIIHTHGAKAGVIGRVAAKMGGVSHIINGVHGITFPDTMNLVKKEVYKNIERFVGFFTDKFITVGDDIKQKYIRAGIGKKEDYITIRSGMELQSFYEAANNPSDKLKRLKAELGIKENEIVIGKISRLEQRKGYKFYLEVAKNIVTEYPEVKFLVVGDGPQMKELKEKAKSLGINENVIFTGYRTDVEDVFSILDIKVLTSLWEGLPRVLVQAAAVGKPIVTFNVDGAWEIVEEEKNGYIVPMKDTEAMTKKLKILIENPELRKKMGEYSKTKVDDSWTRESMVNQIDQVYQELVGKER